MPQVGGRLSLSTHKGMEFPADFHEHYLLQLRYCEVINSQSAS
ncbi:MULTISPECIES: hypothetical protein [Calothrix]|nr:MULTISPECIES: hypothetical protein [Calothrix]